MCMPSFKILAIIVPGLSLSMCMPSFKILAIIVPEKTVTQKNLRNYGITELRDYGITDRPNPV